MQQKEIAKGTGSCEAPALEACLRCGCSCVEQLVGAVGGQPGARGTLKAVVTPGWGWGMFRAVGFAEQEGVSAAPQNAVRRDFLGIISVAGAPRVPPAVCLLP